MQFARVYRPVAGIGLAGRYAMRLDDGADLDDVPLAAVGQGTVSRTVLLRGDRGRRQGRSGLGLDAQKKAVREYLNGGDWKIKGEFTEVESGKRADRPQLAAALAACRLHGAKLIIAKLDRLARNVAFVSNLMEGATYIRASTRLTCAPCQLPVPVAACSSAMSTVMIHIGIKSMGAPNTGNFVCYYRVSTQRRLLRGPLACASGRKTTVAAPRC
jgi:hypothetical protein